MSSELSIISKLLIDFCLLCLFGFDFLACYSICYKRGFAGR
ncbi:hypothetical protein VCHA38O209_140024 [Vibrio chagasii]|nr:hypothetical protein VCHA38O209_140024 [Vibrio chagasii]